MKKKILSLVGILAIVFVAAVIWRMDQFIREDRSNWAQAQMRTQVLSLQQSIEATIQQLQKSAVLLQSPQRDKSTWSALAPFVATTWVRDLNNPSAESIQVKDNAGIDDTGVMEAVKSLQGKKVDRNEISFYPWKDSRHRQWILAVWTWSDNRKLVLLSGTDYLQSYVDGHKGSLSQLAVMSREGYVLAHTRGEYFGTRLNDHPMYKEYLEAGSTHGGGSFADSGGQNYLGYFNQVKNSNILLMATSAHHELLADKNKIWASFAFIGFGLVLFTLGGLALMKLPEGDSDDHQVFIPPPHMLNTNPPITSVTYTTTPSPKEAPISDEDRHEAYKKIASAIGHELRGPLTRILGFGQMIQTEGKDPQMTGYVESILRESRQARDVLEKLFSFAQERDMTSTKTRLSQVVKNVMARIQPELTRKEIKLIQEVHDTPETTLAAKPLERAIENIIQNSVEALSRRPKKEIRILVQQKENGSEIIVEDTGEGIEPENISKVFDPFFTTRSFSNHTGLGLSAAYGVAKQHGGDVHVESERGKGTKVSIFIPQDTSNSKVAKTTQTIPEDLPTEVVSFSPADVEIESLLDFSKEEEEVTDPIGLVSEESLSNIPVIDDDRTVAIGPINKQDELALEPDTGVRPVLEKIDQAVFKAPRKTSILDEYRVEIRRPRTSEKND